MTSKNGNETEITFHRKINFGPKHYFNHSSTLQGGRARARGTISKPEVSCVPQPQQLNLNLTYNLRKINIKLIE